MTGHTNGPPPEMLCAFSPAPTRAVLMTTRLLGPRLCRFMKSRSTLSDAMIFMPLPSIHTGIAAGSNAAWSMGNTSMDDIDNLLLQGDGVWDDVDRVRINNVDDEDASAGGEGLAMRGHRLIFDQPALHLHMDLAEPAPG